MPAHHDCWFMQHGSRLKAGMTISEAASQSGKTQNLKTGESV
jgi:hypothetical protein